MTFLKLAMTHIKKITPTLQGLPVFAGIPATSLHPLLDSGTFRQLESAEFLFHEKENTHAWWLLLEGELDALRYGSDGEERIFGQVAAPDLVADVLMFVPDGRFPVSTRARTPCLLFQMQRQHLHRLCEREPQVAMRLLAKAGQRLCRRIDEVEFMARGSGAQRLAAYLLRQLEQQGPAIELRPNQRQLAATLGLRAETLNRLLSDWLRQGYLQGKRRHWQVIDSQALSSISQGYN